MDTRHLEYFIAVAEEGSFTRAAHRLQTVQSAVSAGVRTLEREVHATLFVRSTRRVELSDAGRALLVVADEGPGIDDRDAALDRGRSAGGSTGLGLDIAARTARAAGGELRLEPDSPGTRVIIDLPLA